MVKDINVYRRYALAGATFSCAISIGFLMQSSEPSYASHQAATVSARPAGNKVETNLPAAAVPSGQFGRLPALPREVRFETGLEHKTVSLLVTRDIPVSTMPEEFETPSLACDVSLTVEPLPAALVSLQLAAPCMSGERVVVHHGPMKFTEIIGADGHMHVNVPALAEKANFVVILGNGDGATANAEVPSLRFYDRVVVQWQGDTGISLHAREYGADYGSEGHVWRERTRDVSAVADGSKGFLTRLGDDALPEPLVAEVYTFPSGSAKREGAVYLSVEADVTPGNCGRSVAAESFEVREAGEAERHRLSLEVPECDAVGELLVLKNLVQDLKIAGK